MNDNNDKGESAVKNRFFFKRLLKVINQTFTYKTHTEEISIEINNEYNSIEKEKILIILQRNGSGSLESKSYFYCKKLPLNHYCLAEVNNSNIMAENNESKHICGRNACILCRSNWGNPEDFTNICIDHK